MLPYLSPGRCPLACCLLVLLISLPLLSLPAPTSACSLAVGGCLPSLCSRLDYALTSTVSGVPAMFATPYINGATNSFDLQIGWLAGLANNKTGAKVDSSRGSAYVNWEVFPFIGTNVESGYLLSYSNAQNLSQCCNLCAKTAGCVLYQWFSSNNISNIYNIKNYKGLCTKWPQGHVDGYNCYLLTGGSVDESAKYGYPEGWRITAPYSPTHTQQYNSTWLPYAPSWVGGHCNPNSSVTGDPHFVGARGTKFEFNGDIGKSFVLISDERLQVNMKLGGYKDSRTEGAALVKDGMAIRTWIRELGFVWKDGSGVKHTLLLKCRTGPQQDIGAGYLSSILLDGKEAPVPREGRPLELRGTLGLALHRTGVERKGYFDVEMFHLALEGLITLKLELRPAHPLLQTTEDSFVHFSVFLESFKPSSKVHGVLGQTFRQSASQASRALEYKLLARLVGGPISVDSESGQGFLDGAPEDYIVNDLLVTDFKYSAFDTPTAS